MKAEMLFTHSFLEEFISVLWKRIFSGSTKTFKQIIQIFQSSFSSSFYTVFPTVPYVRIWTSSFFTCTIIFILLQEN